MATKIDSSVEPSSGQSTVSVSSSVVAASSAKVSKFGAKSGFVIPKNKLSGSLVPIYRGTVKAGSGSTVKDESTTQVQRKTKWSPDLTQDATVRKGRALAYQTRLEQITQELKLGALEIGADQGSHSPEDETKNQATTDHVNQEAQKFELLQLERCEIIGEILRLNPSYKAPPDYKPLLKEGKVPIPVKEYPGYNFIGLLLGPESNTQKRLEEETGAKIQVYGIKANAKEKCEITQSDIAEAQCAYEELYVNVAADTYEKVDAAVALIELLVTPVSGNAATASKMPTPAAGDANTYYQGQENPTSGYSMMPVANANQGASQQPMLVSAQSGQQQFQQPHAAPWFPSQNTPSRPASIFMPLPIPSNSVRFPQSPSGLPNMPPYFGRPAPFGLVQRTPPPQFPNQAFPFQNNSMPSQRPPSAYSVVPSQPSSSAPASRPPLTMPMLPTRPPASANLQPSFVARSPMPATPGWSPAPPAATQPLGQNLPIRPPQAGPPVPNNTPRPPSANFAPSFPPQPSSAVPSVVSSSAASLLLPVPPLRPYPVASAPPASVPQPILGASTPFGAQTMVSPRPAPVQTLSLAPRPMQPSVQPPAVASLASGSVPSFTPISTPIGTTPVQAPKPLRPSFSDFTFQPQRAQVPASPTMPGPNSTPRVQNTPSVPLAAPHPPSFRPALQGPAALVGAQSFPQPPKNSTITRHTPRFPGPPVTPIPQMGPPSFLPPQQGSNFIGQVPAPSASLVPPQQSLPPPLNRPGGLMIPSQQMGSSNPLGYVGSRVPPAPGGNQTYDPFSPTSILPAPPQAASGKSRKPDTDPEYEDLMASVGVK